MSESCPGVRVVGIAGSLRDRSYTRMAVASALEGARTLGAETRLVDLRDYTLPFAEGQTDDGLPEGVRRLREVGKQVTRFAFLYGNDEMREFLRMWEDSMPNLGGAGR